MNAFKGYRIEHVQLAEWGRLPVSAQSTYFVCWNDQCPLGHLWWNGETRENLHPESFSALAAASIRPALDSYFAGTDAGSGWLQSFESRDYAELARQLTVVFAQLPENSVDHNRYTLTVVICTRNRPGPLAQCLTALAASEDKDFELLVIDNAPDDDQTAGVVKKFPFATYLCEPRKGLDRARNRGALHASGKIIAYTDDDVQVSTNWTRSIKHAFFNPVVMAVTGMVIPVSLDKEAAYRFEKYWGFNKGYQPKLFDRRWFLDSLSKGPEVWHIGAGANMAFRREVFDLVGLFDERLDVGAAGCSGDSEFWYRVLAEGWNCLYLPSIWVFHAHREQMEQLNRQLFAYMRGQAASLLTQHQRYGHRGNLRKLYLGLPKYYATRIRNRILRGDKTNFSSLFTEMRGCFSGWWYFLRHRRSPSYPQQHPPALPVLHSDEIRTALVSIIIPCYNHGRYLAEAIESVQHQTHQQIEIIVIDDGSTDNTLTVCRNYPKVRYVRSERIGLSAARNTGVQHSSGQFLVFLDADDLLLPAALQTNLKYFMQQPELAFVSGAHERTTGTGDPLPAQPPQEKEKDNYWSLLHGNYIAMEATVMYRRELFFHFHFDPRLPVCEDYALNLSVSRWFPVLGHTEKLAVYRIHGENMSADNKIMRETVLTVLENQKSFLRDTREKKAWQLGRKNWKKYYS